MEVSLVHRRNIGGSAPHYVTAVFLSYSPHHTSDHHTPLEGRAIGWPSGRGPAL